MLKWVKKGMETKKLGFLIVGLSVVLGFVMFGFMNSLGAQSQQLQCNPTQECQQVNSVLGVSHIAVGFLSFIFALGFYLLFFNKNEKMVLERHFQNNTINQGNNINNKNNTMNNNLKNNNNHLNNANNIGNTNDKFSLLLRPLDENERKVLVAVKEQEGITQSTLRFRADLSKAKVSQILTNFEKKKLIERKVKGKTYSVFLAENF
jgi:hypothetical protein|tara:strand:- start:324 stop:941 length:618 start_codon:yes stop_codon:yes gene_type:complete